MKATRNINKVEGFSLTTARNASNMRESTHLSDYLRLFHYMSSQDI